MPFIDASIPPDAHAPEVESGLIGELTNRLLEREGCDVAAERPERRAERERSSMLGVEGNSWDIAWAAVYLASDEARWVTAQVLVIDAGVTLTVRGGTGG